MDEKLLLDFAMGVGELMLKNGAETQRVENTVEIILQSKGYNLMPETFITPTAIFAGITGPLSGSVTKVKRIQSRSINLDKVAAANELSRNFVEGKICVRAAFDELNIISEKPDYKLNIRLFAYGVICMSFTLLFNGSVKDSLLAIIVGYILGISMHLLEKTHTAGFVMNLIGSLIITLVIMMFNHIGICDNYEKIIIGVIMPLVPGYAITNGTKDIMYGDHIAGGAMMIEAMLLSVFIAAGVAIGLLTYQFLVGGSLL